MCYHYMKYIYINGQNQDIGHNINLHCRFFYISLRANTMTTQSASSLSFISRSVRFSTYPPTHSFLCHSYAHHHFQKGPGRTLSHIGWLPANVKLFPFNPSWKLTMSSSHSYSYWEHTLDTTMAITPHVLFLP